MATPVATMAVAAATTRRGRRPRLLQASGERERHEQDPHA